MMPTSEEILAGLTTIANEWRGLALFWHVFVGAWLLAILIGQDVSNRVVGLLLVLPLLSVSALAWASHNPFNGAVFAVLSLVLATVARRLPPVSARLASWPFAISGGALAAFGWTYPHFLDTTHWASYLIAAPLGLLPCPTLSAVSGLTLIVRGFGSTAWTLTLASVCFIYGVIGVFRLQVTMDAALLAGAMVLIAIGHWSPFPNEPRHAGPHSEGSPSSGTSS